MATIYPYYDHPEIQVRYYNEWADPDILYNDYCYNYYDVTEALYEAFYDKSYEKAAKDLINKDSAYFKAYLLENATDYLEELKDNDYFQPGSKSWHDDLVEKHISY